MVFLLMTFVWVLFLWKKNPATVDAFWSIAITLAALTYNEFSFKNSINIIVNILLLVWALRLFGYLFLKRVLPKKIDKRYTAISDNWSISTNIGFFLNFQFQAFLALFISIPFFFTKNLTHWNALLIFSLLLVIIGIIGESIADFQLQKFKSNHNKKVCDAGLWKYSRHPNYFFEWLIWLGFSLPGGLQPIGLFAFISPLLLLFLMLKVTGPITERLSIKSRGKLYLDYQDKTSMFFLWPPKKG